MKRKRIVLSTESSLLATGYGTMTVEIAKRLQAAGHDVAEVASYAYQGDPRLQSVPWRVYPVAPNPDDKEAKARYDSDPYNQFGKFAFEEACMDFRGDTCVSIRDSWMEEHVARSALRPYYGWLYLPTVDSLPQRQDWLDTFSRADALFTYTDWAADVLKEQAGDRLNLCGSSPPGVDFNLFRPLQNKAELRTAFGIPHDALLCGFISRNQQRKRFPEMADAFRLFLDTAPAELSQKTYLYWHTSWPDVGWDTPGILKDAGIASKVFFTYKCKDCHATFSQRWSDARTTCIRCGKPSATLPNTNQGLEREEMVGVCNLFDVYCQFSNSEGMGLSLAEAAACGVPVMATDFSGMADVVRKLQGTPIAVKAFYREVETGCQRAIPDGEDFAMKLQALLLAPDVMRRYKGGQARSAAIRHYDWDKTIQKWLEAIDRMTPQLPWNAPPHPHQPSHQSHERLTNAEFIHWGFCQVAGRSDLSTSHVAQKMLRDLNWGATLTGSNNHFHDESFIGRTRFLQNVDRSALLQIFHALAAERNHWEQRREEVCCR